MKGLLFTYGLTYGGAVLALFDPFIGLLIYVSFAILRPEALWFWAFEPGNNFSGIVGWALVIGWTIRALSTREYPSPSPFATGRARALLLALFGVWGWAQLSGALAPFPEVSQRTLDYLTKIVVPFVVGFSLIDSMTRLRTLAWVIVLSEGYVALEMNLSYLGGYNRLYYDGLGTLDNNSAAIAMVTCIGPAVFLGMYAGRWWQKVLGFACAALLAHAVLFSFSRGAMLAMIAAGLVGFVLLRPAAQHYLVLIGAGLLGLRLAGSEVRERFLTLFAGHETRDSSAQSRLDLWRAMWDVMQRQPILGAGPDHWPLLAESYGFSAGKEGHSLWLQWGAETGLVGLGFLVLFYGLCVWRLWPLAREQDPQADPWRRGLASLVIVGLTGFAVSAQFVSLKLLEVPYYVALVGAGLLKLTSIPEPSA